MRFWLKLKPLLIFTDMQLSILWKGIKNDTDEHCAVNYRDTTISVHSEIEGWVKRKPVYAEYWLTLNNNWEVRSFEISANVADKTYKYSLGLDDNEHWKCKKNLPHFYFEGCNYIGISLTPLTNTLPVNNLHLLKGESKEISLIYVDILANEARRERQKYTRLDEQLYRFDNLKGFTADIEVDKDGFVVDYPGLFELVQIR